MPQGASWGLNDTIVYSARTERVNDTNVSRAREELWKVPAAGGEPVPFELQLAGTQDAGAPLPRLTWPYHLPDGEHLLISFGDNGPMFVASLASGELTPAVDGIQGQYLPGARSSGHIVYREPGERVRAVAFDLASLQVTGDPFPLFENVFRGAQSGWKLHSGLTHRVRGLRRRGLRAFTAVGRANGPGGTSDRGAVGVPLSPILAGRQAGLGSGGSAPFHPLAVRRG